MDHRLWPIVVDTLAFCSHQGLGLLSVQWTPTQAWVYPGPHTYAAHPKLRIVNMF